MSVKLDILNDIVTAVEAIVDINGVRVINTVELWNSQLENLKEEQAFNFPAVYVEFGEIPWLSTNQLPQALGAQGNVTGEQKAVNSVIIIHIAFFQLETETVSLPIIDPKMDKVYFAIQRLSKKDKYTLLIRNAERQDTDHDMVIDWQMDFLTTMFQCGEEDNKLIEIPGSTLDLETNVTLDIDNDVIRTGV